MSDDIDIAGRLAAIERQIAEVERVFNHEVRIVAVTKGFGEEAIEAAVSAGCSVIGENYAQELATKRAVIERLAPEVHFIGRLQTNKVRLVADLVDVWASLDRASLVDEVAKRATAARVLIQVDATGDPAKGGCSVAEVTALVARARDLGLVVDGLMTVGPTGEPAESARKGFRQVRDLVDDLGLDVCSMGMSGDLEVAVQEGSTEVRIGTALFGPRPPRR
ncbi:MAG TPA: YggS family pyridoxal phosphate-dependent enzyme [Ilumatobacteraceae bacterium]|nr:YggS family pyridoxal phosphate-dependent enzyme [Ilumatobacteraceae bacterium]